MAATIMRAEEQSTDDWRVMGADDQLWHVLLQCLHTTCIKLRIAASPRVGCCVGVAPCVT